MDSADETICAISTALGGAVSIIRISGPESDAIGGRVWHGRQELKDCPPREMTLGRLHDASGSVLDPQCLAVRMPGPHSYTGEDVVELQCHGGALCARLALEAITAAGGRLAEPGEFTKRAFLHGQMDLTQAEAVSELIGASSAASLKLAGHQLAGQLGRRIRLAYDRLEGMLAEVESRMDFPEEELDWRDPEEMCRMLHGINQDLAGLLATRRDGEILRGGVSMVIVGPPNVGKSSLLNWLLGRDRAIVTAIPGTTRDTIETSLTLRGIPIRLVDTAGIRESGDEVEKIGIGRSRESAEAADLVLWVVDGTQPLESQGLPSDWVLQGKVLFLANKADLLPEGATMPDAPWISISAQTGIGMDKLAEAVVTAVGLTTSEQPDEVAVAARHAALLEDALKALRDVDCQMRLGEWELAALAMRQALASLGRITGQAVEPDVLETIFSKFCIGK